MSSNLVSIIVPSYNHSAFLNKRLQSIFDQSYVNFEVIFLDDASQDESVDILKKYENNPKVVSCVYSKTNSTSTFKQWAKGISLSNGKYIWIAESDDYASLDFLSKMVAVLDSDVHISMCYCKSIRVNENDAYIDDMSFWYEDLDADRWQNDFVSDGKFEIISFAHKKNIVPNASAVLFRKSSLVPIDENILNMKFCGDWFFWLKLMENGKVAYVANLHNYFRLHQNTVRTKYENLSLSLKEKEIIMDYLAVKSLLPIKKRGFLTLFFQSLKNHFHSKG